MTDPVFSKIVGHDRKPFDTDRYGQPIYVEFDVLECGHKVKRFSLPPPKNSFSESAQKASGPSKNRRCKQCEKEQDG